MAALVGVGEDEFRRRWTAIYRASQTGPLADAYLALGVPGERVEAEVAERHAFARRALRPRPGTEDVLADLRLRGVKLAVLSVCSEEVPATWPETELAGLFDVETFSVDCGLMKPEPEIYLRTARALGVEPADCFFVGDGANDELDGARRVGMTPVLFLPDGEASPWPEVRGWQGLRVRSMEEVLELC
jgi:putative hydrolase of the HAD superfamily